MEYSIILTEEQIHSLKLLFEVSDTQVFPGLEQLHKDLVEANYYLVDNTPPTSEYWDYYENL